MDGWQHPPALVGGVNLGAFAEAERAEVFIHAVYGEAPGQVVKVHVTGFGDGHIHVYPRGMAGSPDAENPVPVLVRVTGQAVPTRIRHRALGSYQPGLQSGHGHEWLNGRTGWILALDGAIEQGHVERIAQGAVVGGTDAVDEQVGIKPRRGDQRQHAARTRIDRNDGTTTTAKGVKCRSLYADIQVQHKVGSRPGVKLLQHPQHPAVGIGLHVLVADGAVQDVLVEFLHAHLADMEGAAVIRLVQLGRLLLVDAPHVADGVGEQLAVGVIAQQLGIHHHPGQAVAVNRQSRPLFRGEAKAQGNGLVGAPVPEFLVEIFQVARADGQQFRQLGQRRVQVRNLLSHDRKHIAGAIIRQQYTVAIINKPALGRQRLQLHPIALGLGAIDFVIGDLQ